MTVSRRPFVKRLMLHVALLPFLIFALFPFYHMTLTSLKQDRELYDRYAVPLVITQGPTLEHYAKLLWDTEFLTWTKNSLMVAFLATGISVVVGTIAAYALARLKFFGVASLGTGIFVTYLVPTSLLFLPLAQVVQWLGLSDSKWALVLTYPTFLVPFCTWLLIGYFRTVPKEVEECALVDGATRIQALWRIVLPMAVPGLVCAALFAFTLSRGHDRADPRRHLLLGFADGGRRAGLGPDRDPVRLLSRLLRLRPDGGRAEVAVARGPDGHGRAGRHDQRPLARLSGTTLNVPSGISPLSFRESHEEIPQFPQLSAGPQSSYGENRGFSRCWFSRSGFGQADDAQPPRRRVDRGLFHLPAVERRRQADVPR